MCSVGESNTDTYYNNIGQMESYLKLHSSGETYSKAIKSMHKVFIWLAIIFVILFVYMFAVTKYVMSQNTQNISPHNIEYTDTQGGRIASGELYYIDNVKYVVDMSKFGYDVSDFESGDTFTIYLDENQKIVDIVATSELPKDNRLFWILSVFLVPITTLLIFIFWIRCSKSNLNPGKDWMTYSKWYNNKEINHEWFTLEK